MDRATLILADSLSSHVDACLARARLALSLDDTVRAEASAAEAGALARQIAGLLPNPGPNVTVTLSERRTHWGPTSRLAGMEKAA